MHHMLRPVRRVAIIGAGPSGLAYLERLLSNRVVLAPNLALDIHVVDPHPFGAGRIWRFEQAPELTLNSQAYDITIFPDEAFTGDGPIPSGPSEERTFLGWIAAVREGSVSLPPHADAQILEEIATLGPTTFPSRRLMALYLGWAFTDVVAGAGPGVTVTTHATMASDVIDLPGRGRYVQLADGSAIENVDSVIYTVGHCEAAVSDSEAPLVEFARRHGLTYVLPQPASAELVADIAPAGAVLVRGLGLTAFDYITLLTEHRGGRFVSSGAGLKYVASGKEPILHLGSRRGVPPRTVPSVKISGIPTEPRHFTLDLALSIARSKASINFGQDLWPLILRDVIRRTYAERFTAFPERVTMGWDDFETAFEALDVGTQEFENLVAQAVPDASDRIDIGRLQNPFSPEHMTSPERHQAAVQGVLRRELALHRTDSTTIALRNALRSAYQVTAVLKSLPNWDGDSLVDDFHGWWYPLYCSVAVAPSQEAYERLLALSEAGIVSFLGPGTEIVCDAEAGRFVATSSVGGTRVESTALIEGRIALPAVAESANPVLRSLAVRGYGIDARYQAHAGERHTGRLQVTERDYFVVDANGRPDPHRQALGAFANANWVGAFALPGADFAFFRQADAVARATLRVLVSA